VLDYVVVRNGMFVCILVVTSRVHIDLLLHCSLLPTAPFFRYGHGHDQVVVVSGVVLQGCHAVTTDTHRCPGPVDREPELGALRHVEHPSRDADTLCGQLRVEGPLPETSLCVCLDAVPGDTLAAHADTGAFRGWLAVDVHASSEGVGEPGEFGASAWVEREDRL
jgi:hypothetical protein